MRTHIRTGANVVNERAVRQAIQANSALSSMLPTPALAGESQLLSGAGRRRARLPVPVAVLAVVGDDVRRSAALALRQRSQSARTAPRVGSPFGRSLVGKRDAPWPGTATGRLPTVPGPRSSHGWLVVNVERVPCVLHSPIDSRLLPVATVLAAAGSDVVRQVASTELMYCNVRVW
jgi:hypothetical protein